MAPSLITSINEEHGILAKLLHRIDRQVMLFSESAGPDLDLLHLTMDYTQAYSDLYHHLKEDTIFNKLLQSEA